MLTWPLPALLTWALAWGLALALRAVQAPWWRCTSFSASRTLSFLAAISVALVI